MCTASWFFTDEGYELFFNRDELRTRGRALAPRRFKAGESMDALAPVDGDALGTWIAGNTAGLTVALLNRYQDAADPTTDDRRRSRGLLVKDLAASVDGDRAVDWLQSRDLRVYAPFTLLFLAPDRSARSLFWNGRHLSDVHDAVAPLVSSGHDPHGVPQVRRALFRQLKRVDRESCLAFHRSHAPSRGAESPCMHRPDARTVSLTHVVVDAESLRMAYADGPPCRVEMIPSAELVLRRRADAA